MDSPEAVDGWDDRDGAGAEGHGQECGEYGFCDGSCRRRECDGACGDFGICDGTCRLAWCDGGCSGRGYCDGTCERRRVARPAVAGKRVEPSLFGERGAEMAAGIRSFADLTTEEVRAWASAEGPLGSGSESERLRARASAASGRPAPEAEESPAGCSVAPGWPEASSIADAGGADRPGPESGPPRRRPCPDPGPLTVVDARSPEFAAVWPARDGALEPRPGLLTSVVRAGAVMIYPPPLFDPRVALATRTGVWPVRDEPPVPPAPRTPIAPEPRPPADEASQKAYLELRQLVSMLIEVMAGRRSPQQVALWAHARVREALRDPATSRYSGTAVLRRVRFSAVGAAPDSGVEALALVQDGSRMRAAAFRFDAVADPARGTAGSPRWQCTALQTA